MAAAANKPDPTTSEWGRWATLLVALYLVAVVVGWRRTLLDDEVWALSYAAGSWEVQLDSLRRDLVHAPLIYLIERAVLHAFGAADSVAKALPLLFALPAIPLFTFVASRTVGSWRFASAMLALGYCHIGHAPTLVRMYGLAVLLAITAFWAWARWRERPTAGRLSLWILACTALVYTHYSGTAIVAAFTAANAWTRTRPLVFLGAAAIVAALFLPWLAFVAPTYQSRGIEQNVAWTPPPTHGLARMPYDFQTTLPPGYNAYGEYQWEPPLPRPVLGLTALALYAGLFAAGFAGAGRANIGRDPWLIPLFTAAWVPALLLFGFSLGFTPAFSTRFLTPCLPFYHLFAARLADKAPRPWGRVLPAVLVAWAALSAGATLWKNRGPSPARQATDLVAEEVRPSDRILTTWQASHSIEWEWRRRLGREEPLVFVKQPGRGWDLAGRTQTPLKALDLGGAERVWLFHTPFDAAELERIPAALSAAGFTAARKDSAAGVALFERSPPSRGASAPSRETP